MDQKLIEESYRLIKVILLSPKYPAYGVAEELTRRVRILSKDDLIHDLIAIFITRKHPEIENLSGYLATFCFKELLNIKRKWTSQMRDWDLIEYITDYVEKHPEMEEYFQ